MIGPCSRTLLASLLVFTAACASAAPPRAEQQPPATAPESPRRAILVSFDSFSEQRVYSTLDTTRVPEMMALFRESACAAHAVPHFPSLTAPGHAALWTGAYGDVNGISGNSQPQLPRQQHTIMETASGYHYSALRAEPIWITAGEAGRIVVGHHVTQAPHAPGYPATDGARDASLAAARQRAERVLAMPNVHVLNGYNFTVAGDTIIDQQVAPPRPAVAWRNLDRLGPSVTPREIAWRVGDDSVFALLHGATRYDRVLVASSRDVDGGVVAAAAPAERDALEGRMLARHFAPPLEVRTDSGSYFLRVRLFEITPDGSAFLLFQPTVVIVDANRPDVAAAYASAVQGWFGNGASRMYERGGFGATLMDGGDGMAELRYLESQELLTLQFMLGAEWAWSIVGATLLADYFPLGDEIDHLWLGLIDRQTPRYRAAVGEPLARLRQRAWEMLDLRLGHLRVLVAREPNAALFVSGDHGMRTTWRIFRPNAALRDAGLLALDTANRIDPAHTHAVAPSGYYVMLNRTAFRDGTVDPSREADVLAAAERALLAVRSPEGDPIVTRIFRPSARDTLGLGGPVGGDLYFELAPGYRTSASARGDVIEEDDPTAGHGFASIAPDMFTVFCAYGPAFESRRIPGVRTVSAAPTVAEWLGIPAPPHAVASSVLSRLLGRRAAR